MWKIDTGSRSGTTTESYANALDWMAPELGQKIVLLKNTHASSSLRHKLSGFAAKGSVPKNW